MSELFGLRSSASDEDDRHSWQPSKSASHDGHGSLPAHSHTHTHTQTYTHVMSAHAEFTREHEDSHQKVISREWSHSDSHAIYLRRYRGMKTLNSLHQHPVSPPCAVLTSVSSASLMHLRTSPCYPTLQKGRGCESVSQLPSCLLRHTVVCVHSALSPLSSRSHSPCGRHGRLFFFFFFFLSHFTLTIDHFW